MDGLQRDLREDLLPALLAAFPPPEDRPRHIQLVASAQLEGVCLLHAARLTSRDASTLSVPRTWSLARWIQSCTFRSPFFGGDEQALTARLRALLPKETIPCREDILDPARLVDEEAAGLSDLALVAGLQQHYLPGASHPKLLPTPLPLVHALRRVADRTLTEGEREAEALLGGLQDASPKEVGTKAHAGDALGWPGHHIAPPLVARWLMTEQRISWLKTAPVEARRESLRFFERHPQRFPWVAFAFIAEGAALDAAAREEASRSWREVVAGVGPDSSRASDLLAKAALTHMAAGVLDCLSDAEAGLAVELSQWADIRWRHRALESLAEAADRLAREAAWNAAMDALLALVEEAGLDAQERTKAALLALRRASASTRSGHTAYLKRLATLAARPPFSHNVALGRELRRLGVSSSSVDSKEKQ
jgi:hypothetical protein